MMNEIGVYVHFPFCRSKCLYCDFSSRPKQDRYFEAYKNAVVAEIDNSVELPVCTINTVFFGGGTPTVLPVEYLTEIMEHIFQYAITSDAEITVEANPGTVDLKSLRALRNAGVNRLSLGLQAWQDHLLKRMGRIHNKKDILRSYEAAGRAGFKNINLDLMFSLPGQTMGDWTETLSAAAMLKPSHISAYSLVIEEGTAFYRLLNEGLLQLPDEEDDRRMYYAASDILSLHGYRQYEISNFALEGKKCRHNIKYWRRRPYLGFGTDSHSFYNNTRWHNTHCINEYLHYGYKSNISGIREEIYRVTLSEAMEEMMFLGLRLNCGVDKKSFYEDFGVSLTETYGEIIKKMMASGLMDQTGDSFYLTAKGRDVSNYVLAGFLLK